MSKDIRITFKLAIIPPLLFSSFASGLPPLLFSSLTAGVEDIVVIEIVVLGDAEIVAAELGSTVVVDDESSGPKKDIVNKSNRKNI